MVGKFIVIYGANNLGKTEQAKRLISNLEEKGFNTKYLKYPIYDLEPTGPRINAALREGFNLSDEELQLEFAQNRRDFEPVLKRILDSGDWIVAEDYKGTGIAWGVTHGIDLARMEEMNDGLYREDLSLLLEGERFTSRIERGHRHEENSDWNKAREVHKILGERYGWEVIKANQTPEEVARNVWEIVEKKLLNS